ncbi:hypothetical protein M0802_001697 [Mischocyttarus mexicanus]|nr:hypothetical protein M0802_001697 [Mischocyttarus mexicanus]
MCRKIVSNTIEVFQLIGKPKLRNELRRNLLDNVNDKRRLVVEDLLSPLWSPEDTPNSEEVELKEEEIVTGCLKALRTQKIRLTVVYLSAMFQVFLNVLNGEEHTAKANDLCDYSLLQRNFLLYNIKYF